MTLVNMNLQVGERLVLLSLLPKEGDFTTLKIIRELREGLSFSEEEHKTYNFKQEGDLVFWDTEKDTPKDVPIGEKATDIIVDALKKLNEAKKLRDEHFNLYEKFVGG